MKIKIGLFSVILFISLILTHSYFALSALLAIIIHESGHVIVAKYLGIKLKECKVSIYGAGLMPSDCRYSYNDEILLCIAGPIFNFFTVLFIFPISPLHNVTFFNDLVISSLFLGILNLLPIKSFDGGRIFYALLCKLCGPVFAHKMLSMVSFIVIFILWSMSVYFLIIAELGLSGFIFSLSLFSRFFINEE